MSKKREVAVKFLIELTEYRQAAKDDAKLLLSKMPLNVVSDVTLLKAYLMEMAQTLSEKYLLSERGTVPKRLTKMIRGYVRGMK